MTSSISLKNILRQKLLLNSKVSMGVRSVPSQRQMQTNTPRNFLGPVKNNMMHVNQTTRIQLWFSLKLKWEKYYIFYTTEMWLGLRPKTSNPFVGTSRVSGANVLHAERSR